MREPSIRRGVVYSAIFVVGCALSHAVHAQSNEASVAARVAKLERALESRGLVDLLQQVESLQQEVQRLRGQIEEQSYAIEQLRGTQRDTYVDIDQRLRNVEQGGGVLSEASPGMTTPPPLTTLAPGEADIVAGTPAPQSSFNVEMQSDAGVRPDATGEPTGQVDPNAMPSPAAPTVTAAVAPSTAPGGPTIDNEASEVAYRDAFSLLKAGQYDESIAAFSDFLQAYPNSQYADNAQYWLGETYYVKREFETAVAEYQTLIEVYPTSKKQSHAMLKIGYSYHEMGQVDQARAVLEDLRSRYAGTTAARLAEERIQRMLAESPPQ